MKKSINKIMISIFALTLIFSLVACANKTKAVTTDDVDLKKETLEENTDENKFSAAEKNDKFSIDKMAERIKNLKTDNVFKPENLNEAITEEDIVNAIKNDINIKKFLIDLDNWEYIREKVTDDGYIRVVYGNDDDNYIDILINSDDKIFLQNLIPIRSYFMTLKGSTFTIDDKKYTFEKASIDEVRDNGISDPDYNNIRTDIYVYNGLLGKHKVKVNTAFGDLETTEVFSDDSMVNVAESNKSKAISRELEEELKSEHYKLMLKAFEIAKEKGDITAYEEIFAKDSDPIIIKKFKNLIENVAERTIDYMFTNNMDNIFMITKDEIALVGNIHIDYRVSSIKTSLDNDHLFILKKTDDGWKLSDKTTFEADYFNY